MAAEFGVNLRFTASGVEPQLRRLQGNTSKLNQAVKKTQGSFDGAANSIRRTGRAAQAAQAGMRGLIGTVGRLAAAYGALRLAQGATQSGIQRSESERRIKFLAREYGEVERLQAEARASAKRFGESQTEANKALADTYARLRPVGVSLKDIVSVYNGFNTAARISGSTAVEASNAFRQLSQALGSGALRGDEFNSIAEQVPGILTAISKETGIAQGKLREYAAEGKITADVVIKALKRIEKDGADQLKEALNGPEQAIRDLQIAGEDVQVALTKTIIPEIATAFRELAVIIKELDPLIGGIGGALGNTLKEARLLIQAVKGSGSAINTLRSGKLPLNVQAAEAEFSNFFGKDRYEQLKADARKAAEAQGIAYSEALRKRLTAALNVIDATPAIKQRLLEKVEVVTAPTPTLAPNKKTDKSLSRGGQIAQALKGPLGLSDAQAAGIVGNLMRESGLNPRINEGGAVGLPRGVGGYGLAQWTGSRQDDLIRFAGGAQAAGDSETQLRFIVHELLGPERRALESLRGARTPEEAAVVFDRDYERSGIKALGERKAGARSVFSELTGGGVGAGLGEYGSLLQDRLDAEQRIAEEKKRQEELLQEQLGTSQQLKAASEDQLYVAQSQGRIQELSRQLAADEMQIHEKFAPLLKDALSDEEKSNLLAAQRNEYLQTRLKYEKDISSLAQEAGFNMGSALAGLMDQNKELTTSQELLKGSYEIISGSLTSSIKGLIDGTKEWNDVLSDVLGQLGSLFLNAAFKGLGSGIGIPGFAGGGYTGDGPRAGGVDGKGGFPAILHPQEQVIDFTASRSAVAGNGSSSSAAFDENAMMLTSSNQMTRERVLERERIQAMNSNPIEVRAESTVINQVEYVTVDQLAASNRQTAREAQARMLSDLKNRPATRAQVGLR